MSKHAIKRAAAIGSVLALAAAPAALAVKPADPGSQGKGHGKAKGPKGVAYVFKGSYAGGGSVDVDHGNAHVRKAGMVGTTVLFDLSSAKLVVDDTNGDDAVTVDDVTAGDRVVVKAKLPRKEPGAQPYVAKQLVDQTNPPADDSADTDAD
jgi:hypothetical protein